MSSVTIEKACMVCGGKEIDPGAFPASILVTVKESICNRCKGVLRDVVMKEAGLNKDTEITFNWD